MLFLDSFWPLLNLEQKFLHIMSENFPLLFSCLFFVTLWLSASQFGSMQDMGKAYFGQCPEKRQVNVISLVVNDFDSPVFWFSQKFSCTGLLAFQSFLCWHRLLKVPGTAIQYIIMGRKYLEALHRL